MYIKDEIRQDEKICMYRTFMIPGTLFVLIVLFTELNERRYNRLEKLIYNTLVIKSLG